MVLTTIVITALVTLFAPGGVRKGSTCQERNLTIDQNTTQVPVKICYKLDETMSENILRMVVVLILFVVFLTLLLYCARYVRAALRGPQYRLKCRVRGKDDPPKGKKSTFQKIINIMPWKRNQVPICDELDDHECKNKSTDSLNSEKSKKSMSQLPKRCDTSKFVLDDNEKNPNESNVTNATKPKPS